LADVSTVAISVYPGIDPEPLYRSQTYKGKVVLITGASRGIGRATALEYAKSGASLALLARSHEGLQDVKQQILELVPHAKVELLVADVTNGKAMKVAVQAAAAAFGKLDIVIANAGRAESFRECECQRSLCTSYWELTLAEKPLPSWILKTFGRPWKSISKEHILLHCLYLH
jgi:NAD(P)-dependent dehydrogenase (short-subunit alcohol dehydrogenase family)